MNNLISDAFEKNYIKKKNNMSLFKDIIQNTNKVLMQTRINEKLSFENSINKSLPDKIINNMEMQIEKLYEYKTMIEELYKPLTSVISEKIN